MELFQARNVGPILNEAQPPAKFMLGVELVPSGSMTQARLRPR
jgi:hypothetical protein